MRVNKAHRESLPAPSQDCSQEGLTAPHGAVAGLVHLLPQHPGWPLQGFISFQGLAQRYSWVRGPLGPARISGCVFCLSSGVESTSSCCVHVGFSPTTCHVHVLRLPSGSRRSFSTFSSCSSHTFLVWFISCIFSGRWEHLVLWGRENTGVCAQSAGSDCDWQTSLMPTPATASEPHGPTAPHPEEHQWAETCCATRLKWGCS